MRRPDSRSLIRIFGTLIALGLLVYLVSQQSWQEIWLAIQQIPRWRLALALLLMLVSRLAVALRWHSLLQAADLEIPFLRTLRITLAGLFASNFLPTTIGGDVVRLAGLLQLQIDSAVAAASLIADRLVGIIGMSMMVPFSIPALSSILGAPPEAAPLPYPAAFLTGVGLRKVLERARRFFTRLYASMQRWLLKPVSLLKALACTWAHMLCIFAILFLLLGGIGEHMPIWMIGGLYSLVYLVTLIPISINGYGVQEISMALIFSNLGRASLSGGLTVALLFRTVMLLASLPGAFFLPDILSTPAAKSPPLESDRSM
ncbi:MAG: hypothetical protein B6D39_05700 [Anaerolineae bacterium UTCFX2]|jgi:uncharacterized membrane protein YbhN (UPF0104 family)|nr:flippase-like domain-containing protein [Anaerolineales bacterium]OQY91861.1 MAG: hypothetical protein B6D39_05700 [Anaerolineae bacterium UTCFX2]